MSINPVEIPTGAVRYNTDSGKMEVYIGSTWMQVAVTSPNLGSSEAGVRGLFMQKFDDSSNTGTIDYITISNQGNATDYGDLVNSMQFYGGACSSHKRWVQFGGHNGNHTNQMQFGEFSITGKPVIASNWSGQVDFLSEDHSLLIGGKLDKVPEAAVWENIIVPESQWFTVDEKQAYNYLKSTFENIEDVKTKGKKLMEENRSKFTLDKMTEELDRIMEKHLKDVPQQVGLKLPKLKSFSSSTKEKKPIVKLPKLKKELVNG